MAKNSSINQIVPAANQRNNQRWPVGARVIVSVIILFHLAAVIISPLTMLMPSPDLLVPIRRVFEPYQQLTYLGHGYQFFAPDPGPSHHVQYSVVTHDGKKIEGHFPDRENHWPRLHYHRWFMLSERTYEINSAILTAERQKEIFQEMDEQIDEARDNANFEVARRLKIEKQQLASAQIELRQQASLLNAAIEDEIRRRYPDANTVELKSAERLIPFPYQISVEKKSLDDEQFLPKDRQRTLQIYLPRNPEIAEEIK
jgi:hypothetical protein